MELSTGQNLIAVNAFTHDLHHLSLTTSKPQLRGATQDCAYLHNQLLYIHVRVSAVITIRP